MTVNQLSFWDNADLEAGYQELAQLQFDRALRHFEIAAESPVKRKQTGYAIETCCYWKKRVGALSEILFDQGMIDDIYRDYLDYEFTGALQLFRRELLCFLAKTLGSSHPIDLCLFERIFDELIKNECPESALELVEQSLVQYPDNAELRYFFGQAYWQLGRYDSAGKMYVGACLSKPDNAYIKTLEPERLKTLAKEKGLAWTPAYGFLSGLLPLVEPTVEPTEDRLLQKARSVYGYLGLAEAHSLKKDSEKNLEYRKQLKSLNPDLFQLYLKLLKRRK